MDGDKEEKDSVLDALSRATPFIKRAVASRISIKNFPHIIFKLDTSIEHGQRINELFKDIQDDLAR
jgi:ribosome-binding factor A